MSGSSNPYLRIIERLDSLVKSRFIEMFGDIRVNTKSFPTTYFGDYTKQMNIGPFGSDLKNDCFVPEDEGYCMVYEQKHAIDKDFTVEKRFVNKEKYEQMRRFDVGPGDILVSCRGTIGKCVLLPEYAEHGIIHPSLMMIKPKEDVNPAFLLMLLEKILETQNEKGSGVKMAVKATELSKIRTIKPPKSLQDQFIEFVHQVDKSKVIAQKAAEKYDQLVKSRFIEMINGADKIVKLGELIKPFKADKCGSNSYPVLSITRWNGLILQSERFKKEIASKDKSQYKIVPRNKLVVAFPIDEGLVCSQTIVDHGIVSPAYDLYSIDETLVHPVVLQYYLRSDIAIQYYLSKLRGTTLRRRTIPREDFYNFDIRLPTLLEQKRYLEFLNQLDKTNSLKQ